jgi:hypothetical protein
MKWPWTVPDPPAVDQFEQALDEVIEDFRSMVAAHQRKLSQLKEALRGR